jgi:hypothetical protein
MPGVHGGGEPARAFAAMTDSYYLEPTRAAALARREPRDEWSELRRLAPAEPLRSALVFGSMLAMCLFLTGRKQSAVSSQAAAPSPEGAQPMGESSAPPVADEDEIFDGPWGNRIENRSTASV